MISPTDQRSHHVWPARIFLLVLVVAYGALPVSEALFIRASSANIPISDTWGYVPVLTTFARTGHVAWGHLFSFYGSGRPALERFGLLLSAKYLTLDVQMFKMLSVAVGVLETACVIWAFRLALPRARAALVLLSAYPVAILVFSFNNWQNLLDEWNVMNLAAVALAFLAVILTVHLRTVGARSTYLLVAVVLVCAFASFTGESGTLSWIVCALLIWIPGGRRTVIEKVAFSITAAVFLLIYFAGTSAVGSGHPLHHVGTVLDFALICLGNGVVGTGVKELPLARVIGIAEVAVVVLLGVLVVSRRLWDDRAVLVATGLVAFGGMGALATGVSRLQFGINAAMSSRYVALAAPVAMGIFLVLVRILSLSRADAKEARPPFKKAGLWALPCLVAAAFCVSGIASDVRFARAAADKQAYYVKLREVACDPSAYSTLDLSKFDHSGGLRPRQKAQLLAQIADLRRAALSVFSDDSCQSYARLPRRGSKGAAAPEVPAQRGISATA